MSVDREQPGSLEPDRRQLSDGAAPAYGTVGDVRTLEHLFGVMAEFPNDEQRARYLLSSNWMRDTLSGAKKRADWCSCGRAATMILDGAQYGPTGYCGVAGWPPLDPCDCGSLTRHDTSVCHIYGARYGSSASSARAVD